MRILTDTEFTDAYIKDYTKVKLYLTSRLRITTDYAEEMTQAAWVRAWECRAMFKFNSSLCTWVCTIARNNVYFNYRQEGDIVNISLDEEILPKDLVQRSCEKEYIVDRELNNYLKLAYPNADLIYQHYYLDKTIAEIAQDTGMTAMTVKLKIHRTLRKVRYRIERSNKTYESVRKRSGCQRKKT